jgi:hypothetical protein
VQRKPLTVRAACRELVKHTDLIAQGYLTYDHRRLKGTHKLRDELGLKIEYLK